MREGDPDAPEVAFRHSVFLGVPLPVRAAVVRHVQTGAGTAGVEEPRPAPVLPQRGEELVRIFRIDHQLRGAAPLIAEKYFGPALSSVDGLEYVTVGVLSPRLSHRRDPGNVRIARMQHDAINALGFVEAEVLPGLA